MKFINENPTQTEKTMFEKYGLYLVYKNENSYRYAPIHLEEGYVYSVSIDVENNMVEWDHDIIFDMFSETVKISEDYYDDMAIGLIHSRMKELMKVHECQEIEDSYVPVKNNNCNRPLVDESFYKALSAFKPDDIKGKSCYITENYISVYGFSNENSEGILYDARMQSVVSESEWSKHCYEYTVEKERKRESALEKQGLFDAFNSLKTYLQSHNSIRKIDCDDMSEDWQAPYKIIKKDLTYGYKLTGFEILEDAVLWEITTYERPIKQNDCIRGMDVCYLMFKNGMTIEVASKYDYKLMCDRNSLSKRDFNEYINISEI